ncbi:MAG: hypothetical protein SFU99_15910 [Saprospiraceae bacterium]|nr:hypothetical protein [Saprospiraceae bacterium]
METLLGRYSELCQEKKILNHIKDLGRVPKLLLYHRDFMMLIKIILLGAVFSLYGKIQAQFVLTDSIEFGPKQLLYVSFDERIGSQPFTIRRRCLENNVPFDSINEVYVKNKYRIVLPHASTPLYMDEGNIILEQFIRGDSSLDEPGKYIHGFRIISKYAISEDGQLTFTDSIQIAIVDLVLDNEVVLQSDPLVITIPVAVEGGGCNYGYSVYDENLNLAHLIAPDLPATCGLGSRMFRGDKEINLIDQDPLKTNVFSWCKLDNNLRKPDCKRITIDSNFHTRTTFLAGENLFISGRKQVNNVNEFFLLIYTRDGIFRNAINTDGLLVRDLNVAGDKIMYFGSRPGRSEVVVLDGSLSQKYNIKVSGCAALMPNRFLDFKNNKFYVYEIK